MAIVVSDGCCCAEPGPPPVFAGPCSLQVALCEAPKQSFPGTWCCLPQDFHVMVDPFSGQTIAAICSGDYSADGVCTNSDMDPFTLAHRPCAVCPPDHAGPHGSGLWWAPGIDDWINSGGDPDCYAACVWYLDTGTVPPPPVGDCPPPKILVNGVCICPPGFQETPNGDCLPVCPPGTMWNGNTCVNMAQPFNLTTI